ncbi:MAG: hypothetical protein RIS54_1576 [Verrucomicrobiota bacterium]|jgi:tetratricopeptide (TPR) repeat protein
MNATSTRHDEAARLLARGQSLEAAGHADALAAAVACYDHAIEQLEAVPSPDDPTTRQLAVVWMNHGNARQRQADGADDAVRSYDRTLSLLALVTPDDALTNTMGAAWLNRGQALQHSTDENHRLEAISSTEQAIGLLSGLPVATQLDYRLNLAGAQVNLAQLLVESSLTDRCLRASAALAAALTLTSRHEQQRTAFADLGLKARRTLCQVIGQWLVETDSAERRAQLIASASDAVDTGMTLARQWERLGVTHFRPLAERLFRFGIAFYRRHQVHFLADFVLENLDPNASDDAFTDQPGLTALARTGLTEAREELRTRFPVIGGDEASERRLQALHHIGEALQRLDELAAPITLS